MNDIVELPIAGHNGARTALKATAHFLGIGLQNIVVGLNPEYVVVAGTIIRARPLISDDLQLR
jgi:predicted NBD/HSP70 family sugar kinase